MEIKIANNERIDQLYAEDVKIIQSKDVFSFSLDAVLLAHFASTPAKGVIVDLCAGNGAVGLFLSRRTQAKITGIELQERLADMGQRSIQLNQLEKQIQMVHLDLKNVFQLIEADSVDLVVCNPPYFKESATSHKNPNQHLAIARHEIHTNLKEVVQVSSKLLKTNGKLSLVHRPERLVEILNTFQEFHLAPKRIQFIYPKKAKEANMLLIEGIKYGKVDGLKLLPPLFAYNDQGTYSDEIRSILYGD